MSGGQEHKRASSTNALQATILWYCECLAVHPKSSAILLKRSQCYLECEQWRPALLDALQVLRADSSSVEAYCLAAQALLGLGKVDESQKLVSKALEMCPGHSALNELMEGIEREHHLRQQGRQQLHSCPQPQPQPQPRPHPQSLPYGFSKPFPPPGPQSTTKEQRHLQKQRDQQDRLRYKAAGRAATGAATARPTNSGSSSSSSSSRQSSRPVTGDGVAMSLKASVEAARVRLGIPAAQATSTLTAQQLQKAYRKCAASVHPDKGGSEEDFIAVGHAYNLLKEQVAGAGVVGKC